MNWILILSLISLFFSNNSNANEFSIPTKKTPPHSTQTPQPQTSGNLPTIENETTPFAEWKYQLLFSFTNNQLNNEAMIFYAKIDPKTDTMDKNNPIVWRREGHNGKILKPKSLQTKKVNLVFSPNSSVGDSAKFGLNFQLYKPGTENSERGINVMREFVVKKENGIYEAYLIRPGLETIPIKQIHSSIHFRNLGKAIIGDPDGTNAYWVRVTSEKGGLEYIVPDDYYQNSKSMPQVTDNSFKPTNVKFVNENGTEVSIHPVKN